MSVIGTQVLEARDMGLLGWMGRGGLYAFVLLERYRYGIILAELKCKSTRLFRTLSLDLSCHVVSRAGGWGGGACLAIYILTR